MSSDDPSIRRGREPEAHVLVVEDDGVMRHLITRLLRENGFHASGVRDGAEMWQTLDRGCTDLILLDVTLPGASGFELLRDLRARPGTPPIVMVTAKVSEADRVRGLDLGADDYLPKPFGRLELLARVRAVLRRGRAPIGGPQPAVGGTVRTLRFAGWVMDLAGRELTSPSGIVVTLSGAEHDLLIAFLENAQRVLGRDRIAELARGRLSDPNDRSVDVLVSRLRRKIEGEGSAAMIRTVRGAGYVFHATVERAE